MCCIPSETCAQVTGRLDNATLELMQRPRCGVPDPLPSTNNRTTRQKRFALQVTVFTGRFVSLYCLVCRARGGG